MRNISSSGSVDIACFEDLPMTNVEWLWKDRIPKGKITVLAGNPGLGKSQITAFLAAAVTGGVDWPDSPSSENPSHVIFLSAEDDPSDTIKPRLMAAGANPKYCHILRAIKDNKTQHQEASRSFQLDVDVQKLAEAVDKIGNVGLIIIDPISAYLGENDGNSNTAIRGLLTPLSELAMSKGIAVVLVTHLNKSREQEPLGRIIGSIGMVAAARVAYIVVKDEEKPEVRYFVPVKSNLGNDRTGFSFFIQETELVQYAVKTSKIIWNSETVDVQKILFPESSSGANRNDAVNFLKDLLAGGKKLPSTEVFEAADACGYNKAAIRKAGKKLGIHPKKESMTGGWHWQLPKEVDPVFMRHHQMRQVGEIVEDDEDIPFY